VTVPPAPAPTRVRVAVSEIVLPITAEDVALVARLAQLLIETGSGATKSLTSEVKESEERLFR
jgi:hypothetical protein